MSQASSRPCVPLVTHLDALAEETFGLWDEEWVGFSWARYTINHTRRVRAVADKLGERERADARVITLAAALHDITKRYDGEIVRNAEGERVVGDDGLWRNHHLQPSRENELTRLYRRLGLRGSLHSASGAVVARHLLQDRGIPAALIERVSACIAHHVRIPGRDASHYSLEADVLFDADTLDANMGLVAFYRNVMIHCHREACAQGHADLKRYLDYLPSWLTMKEPFIQRMTTQSGRQLAQERQQRNVDLYHHLAEDLSAPDRTRRSGLLDALTYLIRQTAHPDIERDRTYLRREWLLKHPDPRARWFCDLLDAEVKGLC